MASAEISKIVDIRLTALKFDYDLNASLKIACTHRTGLAQRGRPNRGVLITAIYSDIEKTACDPIGLERKSC